MPVAQPNLSIFRKPHPNEARGFQCGKRLWSGSDSAPSAKAATEFGSLLLKGEENRPRLLVRFLYPL